MAAPRDRKYLPSHEWHAVDGQRVTIGITQLAADQLSDVTYVELPAVGRQLKAGDVFGEIESVKATSELYTGIGGKVIEVNPALEDSPELVNNEPYEGGWMIRLEAANLADVEKLLSAAQYDEKYRDELG